MTDLENVYILQAGDYVKIGVSNNIKNRINQMQTGNPKKIKLIASKSFKVRSDAFYTEGLIHQFLMDFRQNGEWFCITLEVFKSVVDKFNFDLVSCFNQESEIIKMAAKFDRRIAEEKSLSKKLRNRDKKKLTRKIELKEGIKAKERIIDLIKMDIKLITKRYDEINDSDYSYLEEMKDVEI